MFYFPFDWTFIVRRTLRLVKPRLFIMMETEIWPNLLRECRQRGVKTVMINGRISSRSYPRYRLVRPFFRRVLADVDRFCMQSEESARRLVDLGADPARVTVTGSLKFDSLEIAGAAAHGKPRERVLRFFRLVAEPHGDRRRQHDARRRGRRAARVRARSRRRCRARSLILAPRHPERFGEVERLARDAGFVTTRRSRAADRRRAARRRRRARHASASSRSSIRWRTAVFVGGSLADHGGHNILEPAIFGKPIVFGPHMQNFKEIAEAFLSNDAAVQVQIGARARRRRCWRWSPIRSAAPGSARRRARWSKPTAARKTKTLDGDRASCCRTAATVTATAARSSVPSAWCIDPDTAARLYGAAAAWRRAWYARDPDAAPPARAPGRQRRQPARRRQRQDADRRVHRAAAARAGRASRDADARLRPPRRAAPASPWSPTARA